MTNTTNTKMREWYRGCYRKASANGRVFAQVKRNGREWEAQIRDALTGDLVRHCGWWTSRRCAFEFCEGTFEFR